MIKLPIDAIPYLRQQRTEYANAANEEIVRGFDADIAAFAAQVEPFLTKPRPEMRFVDIGCGIGFSLLGLSRIYGREHNFVGVDRGAASSKVAYGFSTTPSAYNSLRLTRDVLMGAGLSSDRIECVDIDVEPFPQGRADIVTSTYAWGFHFPVDVYLDQVEALLAPDGVIIIDVRRGFGQEEVLRKLFDIRHAWPGPAEKCDRMILTRIPG